MSAPDEIVCRPTKWFYWRVVLMLLMFAGFAAYFLYDYRVGYPEKNLIHGNYRAFHEAGQLWKEEENRARWPEVVKGRKIPFDDKGEDLPLPTGAERDQPWPEVLADGERLKKDGWDAMWRDYAAEREWPQYVEIHEGFYTPKKVNEQLWAAGICGVLSAVALFFLIRTRGRFMKADGEAYYEPGGPRIPYGQMVRVDKRKWESKGLATIFYQAEDGSEKRAKVDGMVYGQFKEEEGAPAEALFQKVMGNFSGEVIELVVPEAEESAKVDHKLPPQDESREAGGSGEPK